MSLNETASADRVHISFFGNRNVGKSSLVNAVTSQNLAVVSDVAGTTTDPVRKAMELLPIGPVVIIDTAGFDDIGDLGKLRVKKTKEILAKTDIAIFVTNPHNDLTDVEKQFIDAIKQKNIPCITVHNKADLLDNIPNPTDNDIWVSAATGYNIDLLKEKIGTLAKTRQNNKRIVSDLLKEGDIVVLVTPIDESAPKGRLILPQQQTIRNIIDSGCIAVVCQVEQLNTTLKSLGNKLAMVITDSQAFGAVSKIVPTDIPLTSFSILFARYKGDLKEQVKGAAALSDIKDGDKILISEGCTHHRQCGDIGTVKLPRWIETYTHSKPEYTFTSGGEFPDDLSCYKLVIHCGACMLNEAEMKSRLNTVKNAKVPIVNYGVAIAHLNGILKRSLEPFPDIKEILEK